MDVIPVSVAKYPFDYEDFEKGDVISTDEIERVLCLSRNDPKFSFALLALRDKLLRGLRLLQKNWTVTTEGMRLNILTDAQAADYNREMFERRLRGANRDHRRNLGVDKSQLNAEQIQVHERALVVQSLKLAAMRRTRKEIKLELEKRKVPGLRK